MTSDTTPQIRRYAPRLPPEERREQILDAVLRVIVEQGVHKVSMDSVAKEAGVARPVLYGHFADSNALLRASLKREEDAALVQLSEALTRLPGATPTEAAMRSLEVFLRAAFESPDRWRAAFVLVDSSTPTFRRHLERGRDIVTSAIEELVRWAVNEGLDPDTDVEMLARMITAIIWDAGRLVLAQPEDYPPERVLDFASKVLPLHLGADN